MPCRFTIHNTSTGIQNEMFIEMAILKPSVIKFMGTENGMLWSFSTVTGFPAVLVPSRLLKFIIVTQLSLVQLLQKYGLRV